MKRSLVAAAVAVAALALALTGLAAPLQQDPRPSIVQPEQGAAVRGVAQIIGTAVHPQFQRYELYYAPWPAPSDQAWVFIGDAKYQQQPLGLLGTWDSRSVPDGAYALRVRVVKQDGNYLDSDPVQVLAANTRPIESPTATPTDTATPEAEEPVVTQPTADATIVAPTVEVSLPTPEPTNTPLLPEETSEPAETAEPTSSDDTPDDSGGFSTSRLVEIAKQSAIYTAGFFAAIAAFFAVKAALVWVWQHIRP